MKVLVIIFKHWEEIKAASIFLHLHITSWFSVCFHSELLHCCSSFPFSLIEMNSDQMRILGFQEPFNLIPVSMLKFYRWLSGQILCVMMLDMRRFLLLPCKHSWDLYWHSVRDMKSWNEVEITIWNPRWGRHSAFWVFPPIYSWFLSCPA